MNYKINLSFFSLSPSVVPFFLLLLLQEILVTIAHGKAIKDLL